MPVDLVVCPLDFVDRVVGFYLLAILLSEHLDLLVHEHLGMPLQRL